MRLLRNEWIINTYMLWTTSIRQIEISRIYFFFFGLWMTKKKKKIPKIYSHSIWKRLLCYHIFLYNSFPFHLEYYHLVYIFEMIELFGLGTLLILLNNVLGKTTRMFFSSTTGFDIQSFFFFSDYTNNKYVERKRFFFIDFDWPIQIFQ